MKVRVTTGDMELQFVVLPEHVGTGQFIAVVPSWPEVRGIHVGACIETKRALYPSAVLGHAHSYKRDQWFGWICLCDYDRLLSRHGGLSWICWHEYAHILTPNHGHDDAWRRKMAELGQEIPVKYQKRARELTAAARL